MNRRTILIAAAVAALLLLILLTKGFGLWGGRDGDTLTLYGNVDIREVDLGFRVPGRIATLAVDEGAKVRKGAVLAQLDPQPLSDALAAAEAQLGVASAELAKQRNGNRPQDIAQAAAAVAERKAALASAEEAYRRREALVKTGAISQALFDATRAEFLSALAQLRAAEQGLSLQKAGARAEDVAAAAAQAASARAQRDKARTDLADATIRAPEGGTILTRAREPGAIVQGGETVFTLTIDKPVRVRAYIPEPDLGRIAPGMKVLVSADGDATRYRGTIGFIASTAEFTPKTVQTEDLRTDLVYRLRIIVTDPAARLRQGQPVTVTIGGAQARK